MFYVAYLDTLAAAMSYKGHNYLIIVVLSNSGPQFRFYTF